MSDDRVAGVLKHIDETTALAGRTDNDRWWQAFCACLSGCGASFGSDGEMAEDLANQADAAIAEAKKRGRL
jgi:hypothetical protein